MKVLLSIIFLVIGVLGCYSGFSYAKPKTESEGMTLCNSNDEGEVECRLLYFAHLPHDDGNLILCRLFSSGRCDEMPGALKIEYGKGVADFKHNLGPEVNGQLTEHLWRIFAQEESMRCEQQSACSDGTSCNVKMNCN